MNDWGLPSISIGHHSDHFHGPSYADKLKAAMADKLDECAKADISRDEVAHRMSEILGQKVSTTILNQYVSKGAGDKQMNVARFMAFIEATGGYDLIGWMASLFDLRVVSEKHAKLIERELLKERLKALEADIEAADADYRGAAR